MDNSTPKFFVRYCGKMSGPFSARDLTARVMTGRISALHEFSTDRKQWRYCVDLDDALSEPPARAAAPSTQSAQHEPPPDPARGQAPSRPQEEIPPGPADDAAARAESEDDFSDQPPEDAEPVDRTARIGVGLSAAGLALPALAFANLTVSGFVLPVLAVAALLAVAGVVVSASARGNPNGRSRATIGIVVGAVALAAWVVIFLLFLEKQGWLEATP